MTIIPGSIRMKSKLNLPFHFEDGILGGINFLTTAFTTVIPFDVFRTMEQVMVSGPLNFTVGPNPKMFRLTYLRLVANGVNIPTFTGFVKWGGSGDWLNTNGFVNNILFFHDGFTSYYSVVQDVDGVSIIPPTTLPPTTTPPTTAPPTTVPPTTAPPTTQPPTTPPPTTAAPTPAPTPAPVLEAPVLTAGTITHNSVQLVWMTPAGITPTDYVVEYKLGTDSVWTTFTDGVSATAGSIVTGLTQLLEYNFRVTSTDGTDFSPTSNMVTATTIANP